MILLMLVQAVYFILPAYFANMAPLIFKKVPFLNFVISKKYFGDHKTYRGVFFAIVLAIIISYIQYKIDIDINIDYKYWLFIGILMGTGAMVGDLVESAVKRKMKIKPGNPFFPFDQIDFILGALIFVSFLEIPPIHIWIICLLVTPILHLATNFIAFKLKIKDVKH